MKSVTLRRKCGRKIHGVVGREEGIEVEVTMASDEHPLQELQERALVMLDRLEDDQFEGDIVFKEKK